MSCGLGEAPYYESGRHTLRFVDIVKEKLHIVDLSKGPSSLESFDLGTPVRSASATEAYFCLFNVAIAQRRISKAQLMR